MKKAILVASFGTSYEETRQKNIVRLENEIANKFSDYKIYSAYTSKFIKRKLNERGLNITDVPETLEIMKNDGITDVIILPTHLLCGIEYDLVCAQAEDFKESFNNIKIGKTLLSDTESVKEVLEIIYESNFESEDEAIVLMGHGSEHFANMVYPAMNYIAQTEDLKGMYIGTVEGYPEIEQVIKSIKRDGYKKVLLAPLMLVAGDHAINDMASDEDDSWKTILEQEGISVRCTIKGLGEYPKILDIYCRKAQECL